jgi:hypothetical protein
MHADRLPPAAELITDLDQAMLLANAQYVPGGYLIWSDVVSDAVSDFYSTPGAREARALIETQAERSWKTCGEFERALKVKRIRKTITPFEEFWLTVAYDLLEMLKTVSLGRHVMGRNNALPLEVAYAVLDAGFYPCGWHRDERICVFDPRGLEGFRPVW